MALVKKELGDAPLASPKGPTPKRAKVTDFTLAHKFEDSRLIRDLIRENGRLIRWASDQQVNCINLETLGLNSTLMSIVADHYCASTKIIKAPGIDFLKAQARSCYLLSIISQINFLFSINGQNKSTIRSISPNLLFVSGPVRCGSCSPFCLGPWTLWVFTTMRGESRSCSLALCEGLGVTAGARLNITALLGVFLRFGTDQYFLFSSIGPFLKHTYGVT